MILKTAMGPVAEGWNQNTGCACVFILYFGLWNPEHCLGVFKMPESLKEPCFLGNGCYREQKAKWPPIRRKNGRHWVFVFSFFAVNIIWPKLPVVCITLRLPEYYECVHILRFEPGPLCPKCPAIYFTFFIPAIINSDAFSEESEENMVSGKVLCHTNVA